MHETSNSCKNQLADIVASYTTKRIKYDIVNIETSGVDQSQI